MNDTTRHGTDSPEPRSNDRIAETTSFARMSAIWVRTVARSWRSGIRDLYSHIP